MWILDNEYNPTLLIFLASIVCLAVFVAWIKTGKQQVLYALGAVVLLMLGLIVAERLMVSDREAIQATLAKIAHDLETNRRESVYESFHPEASALRTKAESELPNYKFSECRVTKILSTKVEPGPSPRTAVVEFNVRATGTFRYGGDLFPDQTVMRTLILDLKQDSEGNWRITNYDHRGIEEQFFQNPEKFQLPGSGSSK